jgi:hypothetical protein
MLIERALETTGRTAGQPGEHAEEAPQVFANARVRGHPAAVTTSTGSDVDVSPVSPLFDRQTFPKLVSKTIWVGADRVVVDEGSGRLLIQA